MTRTIIPSLITLLLLFASCRENPSGSESGAKVMEVKSGMGLVGDTVSIIGTGFGSDQGKVRVLIDGIEAEIIGVSDSEIRIIRPFGIGTGKLEVLIDGVGAAIDDQVKIPLRHQALSVSKATVTVSEVGVIRHIAWTGITNARVQPGSVSYQSEFLCGRDTCTTNGTSRLTMNSTFWSREHLFDVTIDWQRMIMTSVVIADDTYKLYTAGHGFEYWTMVYNRDRGMKLIDVPFTVQKGPRIIAQISGNDIGSHVRSFTHDTLYTYSQHQDPPSQWHRDTVASLGTLTPSSTIRIELQ